MSVSESVSSTSFSHTLPRLLVHRAAVAEVFVTAAERRSDDTLDVCAQIPRSHAFYGDRLGARAGYDPMVLLEIARQSCLVLTHELIGVATTENFLIRTVELEVLDPSTLSVRNEPTDVVTRCHVERRLIEQLRGRPALTGLVVCCTPVIDGIVAAVVRMDGSWVDRRRWTAMRRLGRSRRGLPPHPAPRVPPVRATASTVGRRDPRNVVISEPWREAGGDIAAELVVDLSHPTLFDHPLDHVPAMLQLEAFRQLATMASAASAMSPVSLSARFAGFAELDLPCLCRLSPAGPAGAFRCTVYQDEVLVTDGAVQVADPLQDGAALAPEPLRAGG